MANPKNQNTFYDRLARLEVEGGGPHQPKLGPTNQHRALREIRLPREKRREYHPFRKIIFYVLVFALLLFGGGYQFNAFSEEFKAQFAQKSDDLKRYLAELNDRPFEGEPMAEGERTASTTPRPSARPALSDRQPEPELLNSGIINTYRGDILTLPSVLASEGHSLEITDLFSDIGAADHNTEPGNITQFNVLTSCEPRRPADDNKVIGVRLSEAQKPTAIQAFDKEDMANVLLQGLSVSTRFGRPIRLGTQEVRKLDYTQLGQAQGHMKLVDVILTDTSAPLYLVLQASSGNIVWNLHLAPDVKLSHVLMIAQGKVAVSGLPDTATYEALNISDFVAMDSIDGDCMIHPWRKPQPNWIAWQKAEDGNTLFASQMATFEKGYAAYNDWYQAAFGVDASSETLTAKSTMHVLLGPTPGQKLPYHMIGGNDLLITKTDYLIAGDPDTRAAKTAQLHNDLMLSALGGELDTLWPNEMTGGLK